MDTGKVVTVWNTPVSQPVSSREDGFDVNVEEVFVCSRGC